MQFVGRFRFYSPFNAMLIHTQMPGAHFVCTARRWRKKYRREIKISARPIVILQPMGPILFVFDVGDTVPLPNAPTLPRRVEDPFQVRNGKIGGQLGLTIENAKRDGVRVSLRKHRTQAPAQREPRWQPAFLPCSEQRCGFEQPRCHDPTEIGPPCDLRRNFRVSSGPLFTRKTVEPITRVIHRKEVDIRAIKRVKHAQYRTNNEACAF